MAAIPTMVIADMIMAIRTAEFIVPSSTDLLIYKEKGVQVCLNK